MIRWVVPGRVGTTTTLPSGLPVSAMTALLARVAPAAKLMVEVRVSTPEGSNRRTPAVVGPTTVTLAASACASAGTPHWPASAKLRAPLAPEMAGPPNRPFARPVAAAPAGPGRRQVGA